jgi:hypothetical protein
MSSHSVRQNEKVLNDEGTAKRGAKNARFNSGQLQAEKRRDGRGTARLTEQERPRRRLRISSGGPACRCTAGQGMLRRLHGNDAPLKSLMTAWSQSFINQSENVLSFEGPDRLHLGWRLCQHQRSAQLPLADQGQSTLLHLGSVIITFTLASSEIGPLAYLVPYRRARID